MHRSAALPRGGLGPPGICEDLHLFRWALKRRDAGVVGDAMLDRVSTEPMAATAWKHRVSGLTGQLGQPNSQDGDGGRGERGDPVFADLSVTGDVCARPEV
jgi:hypothetical protein